MSINFESSWEKAGEREQLRQARAIVLEKVYLFIFNEFILIL